MGWELTDIACSDDNSSGDIASASADFVLDAGETVTCVFTSTALNGPGEVPSDGSEALAVPTLPQRGIVLITLLMMGMAVFFLRRTDLQRTNPDPTRRIL